MARNLSIVSLLKVLYAYLAEMKRGHVEWSRIDIKTSANDDQLKGFDSRLDFYRTITFSLI